jgi:hypothetical protein
VVWLNSGVCKSHLFAGLNVQLVLRAGNKGCRRATIVRSAFRSEIRTAWQTATASSYSGFDGIKAGRQLIFYAFSSREPVSTSLENAIASHIFNARP